MSVRIIVDSASDLTKERADALNLDYMPLKTIFGETEEMYNGAEILVDLARRYPELWNEIDRQCTLNRERYGLLCEILLAGDEERCEDVVAKIYRYGSMIGKQDLIGRQIFLWLLQALRMEEIAML